VVLIVRELPRVGVTMGDPAGIGPEVARAAADDPRVRAVCRPLLYGPPDGAVFEPGVVSADAGRAAVATIERAVRDAGAGTIAAIATAPISKLALARAGLPRKGHTDLLAALTGVTDVAMMFWSESLRVVLATVHVPLIDVPRLVTRDTLRRVIDLACGALPSFGYAQPRLALAGLNPHAGEAGVLGHEEQETLAPAIAEARARGIRIDGPFPGDTVFLRRDVS
jgi:4-hydroxy-L-threonine phosphate dehydrogenase PdxA